MRITIEHETTYDYDGPAQRSVQHLLLTPRSFPGQSVVEWLIDFPGLNAELTFTDAYGNIAHLVTQTDPPQHESIIAKGIVETQDQSGVVGRLKGDPPVRLFLRMTDLTRPGRAIEGFAANAMAGHESRIDRLHALMAAIHGHMRFDTEVTDTATNAQTAFREGHGVCQDYSHIFIGAARHAGIPARYVTGYLAMESDEPAVAHHAWAEAYVPDLGWVGFDTANAICPADRHVRLAAGLDAASATPVRGVRMGSGGQKLNVRVSVHEHSAQ